MTTSIFERLITLIAPHECMACGREGSLLCVWCAPEAVDPLPERCYRCYKLSAGSKVCPSCKRHSPLGYVWVRTQYDDAAKKLVYLLKFNRAQAVALPIASLMTEALPYLSENTIVVPVPTATSRRRQRGYDHAEKLAKEIARVQKFTYQPALSRLGQSRQVGATRQQRQLQLKGAYRVTRPVTDANILLVDDIVTTGSSLEHAANILRRSGAKTVNAIVFAQKQ